MAMDGAVRGRIPSWLVWGLIVFGLLLLAAFYWVWSAIGALDRRGADLEASLATVPTTAALATTFVRQEDVDALAARVGAIEANVKTQTPTDLTPLSGEVSSLKTQVASLQSAVSSVQRGVDANTEVDLAPLQERVDSLETAVAVIPDVTALEGRIGALSDEVASIPPAPDLAPLQMQLDSLAAKLASIAPVDLGPIESDVSLLKNSVSEAPTAADLSGLHESTSDLSARVTSIDAELGRLRLQADDLKTSIAALQAGVADKAEVADLKTLAGQTSDLEERVERLLASDPGSVLLTEVDTLKIELESVRKELASLPQGDELAVLKKDLNELREARPTGGAPLVIEQVFFDVSSSTLADDELAKLTLVAERLRSNPQQLSIVGFTDTQGPSELNRAISLRRAATVRSALISLGVDPSLLTSIAGMGEDAPPIATADNTREAGNRVVQIYGYQ